MNRPKFLFLITLLTAVLAASCVQAQDPIEAVDPTAVVLENAQLEPAISTTEGLRGTLTLTVWLPPSFDPNSGSPAGDLLNARLNEFLAQYPEINLDIRIKAEDGPGGLLPTLIAAQAAAPLAVPDLIALPGDDLETAAIKGLLHPIGDTATLIDSEDWFDYALDLAKVQDSLFGYAFAGDALVMAYRPSEIPLPPDSLESVLDMGEVMAFPAASSESLFTLNLYLADGGQIEDVDGRPFLNPQTLEPTLTFYSTGAQSGATPFWLTQLETFSQSRKAFDDGQADMVVGWSNEFLAELGDATGAAPLPGPGGPAGSLATGWIWSLTSQDPVNHEAAITLAEFLVDSEFLGEWTTAAGVLPTRPAALEAWPPSAGRTLVSAVAGSARAVPPANLLAILGPALQGATVDVLKQLSDPATAAQGAAGLLNQP